jgi:predicted dehydrogenase
MSLGLAFLGSGLATDLHSATLRAVAPEVSRWYASRDPGRAVQACRRHHGAGHLAGYDAALASRDVGVVLVGLPPALHLEWTLRALAAGKHVIVEKPPFLRTSDFLDVESAARDAGRQVLVAENYFYKPLTSLLRRVIARGDLGEIRFIQVNALKRQRTGDWRDNAGLAGGGALFEGGIHWVSLLASIGLTPCRIRAALPGRPTAGERNVLVTIEYDEGAVAALAYSWDLPAVINGVRWSRMFGTAGSLRFETNGLLACVTGRRPRVVIGGLRDLAGYRGMMTDFLAAIRENRPPRYTLALARRDLQLIEEAYASAREQTTSRQP